MPMGKTFYPLPLVFLIMFLGFQGTPEQKALVSRLFSCILLHISTISHEFSFSEVMPFVHIKYFVKPLLRKSEKVRFL